MKKASPKLIRGFLEAKASEDAGFKAAFRCGEDGDGPVIRAIKLGRELSKVMVPISAL